MKSGRCPKCTAANVHMVDGNRFEPHIALRGLSAGAFLNAYVCVNCGYVEMYVEDKEDWPKIAERWPRVSSDLNGKS